MIERSLLLTPIFKSTLRANKKTHLYQPIRGKKNKKRYPKVTPPLTAWLPYGSIFNALDIKQF
jgi:hypothetical protein